MKIILYTKFFISIAIYISLWLLGLLINFFGWKDLGSHALPLYVRLIIFFVLVFIFLFFFHMARKKTNVRKKIILHYMPYLVASLMLLNYIWQDFFYNAYIGSTFLVFHPGLVISLILYITVMIMGIRYLYILLIKKI